MGLSVSHSPCSVMRDRHKGPLCPPSPGSMLEGLSLDALALLLSNDVPGGIDKSLATPYDSPIVILGVWGRVPSTSPWSACV